MIQFCSTTSQIVLIMKTFIKSFVAVAFAIGVNSAAQAQAFQKSNVDLNLGVSLGSTLTGGSGYTTSIPPVSASLDFGVTDKISVGGFLGYSSAKYKFSYFGSSDYEWKYSYAVFGVRGAYHFDLSPKFDTYAGAMLGYNVVSVTAPSDFNGVGYSAAGSSVALGAFIGGRYLFTEKIGAFAELGYGLGYLTLGLNVKIK